MINTHELYALSKVKGVGPVLLKKILEELKERDINSLFDSHGVICGLVSGKSLVKEINHFFSCYQDNVDFSKGELSSFKKDGISVISCLSTKYPKILLKCKDYPPFLFCRGDSSLLNDKYVASVVGTRKNTKYGAEITKRTVKWLVSNGFTVVSGLAIGIDEIAHKQCVVDGGKTIAVVVDVCNIYPKSNEKLAQEILDGNGLIVSENLPSTRVSAGLLVKRDRIQSGLSLGVFAIESTIDGGTLHAVKKANEYGRKVFMPDVESGFYENTDIPQLEGIKNCLERKVAEPYSKKSYSLVLDKMKALALDCNGATVDKSQGILF